MKTFTALGFSIGDITTLPDSVLTVWPEGIPLEAEADVADGTLFQVYPRGDYTIRLWHPLPGHGLFDFATISHPDQPDVRVDDVETIEDPSPSDLTGEGEADIIFHIRGVGSAHCCWGTKVYNLGATPRLVLDIMSPAYQLGSTGQGTFDDPDADGRWEFITLDPLPLGCTQPTVQAILRYDAGAGRYVGATPAYAPLLADLIAELNTTTTAGGVCEIYKLVATLMYAGRDTDARAAFDRLYSGPDAIGDWATLSGAVRAGRYYVAP
jgi:hypothetical protein